MQVLPDAPVLRVSANGKLAICKIAITGSIPVARSSFGSQRRPLVVERQREEVPATSQHCAVEVADAVR